MASKLIVSPGMKFGFFTILSEGGKHRKPNGASVRMFNCKCKCGLEKTVRLSCLTSGATVSCGCFHRENSLRVLKKSVMTHGQSRTRMYFVWNSMIQRCTNKNNKSYHRYGGRGISVCEAWAHSFEKFSIDMGERKNGMTLERIDTNGNYEPGNVRWASYTDQARNTRRNHLHTIDGVTHCLAEWCEILGEPWTTVKKRVAAGNDPFIRQRKRRSA